MISITNEYGIYLYTEKIDMRKDIDGLCGVVKEALSQNPFKQKSIFIFQGRNPRMKKILIREYDRFELTKIRLDQGRFIKPITDGERTNGKISWSDYVMLTEAVAVGETKVKFID